MYSDEFATYDDETIELFKLSNTSSDYIIEINQSFAMK